MSDFVRDLVGRTLGVQEVVRPRIASTFEPGGIAAPPVPPELLEAEVAMEALSPAPTSRRSVAPVAREVAPARRDDSPEQPPPRRSSAGSPTMAPQPIAEGAALGAAPAPHVAPLAAAPEPPRATEPVAHPPVEVGSPREHATPPARVAVRNALSPRSASPPEPSAPTPPEPSAASQPAGPATARARVVETRVVERSGEVPITAAELPVATRPTRATGETTAGPSEPGSAEPVVHVYIDRIEVRAPATPTRPRAPRPREPRLSLDDYLAQTRQGRR